MQNSRRAFLRNSVIAAAGLPLLGCGSESTPKDKDIPMNDSPAAGLPYLDSLGIQLWFVTTWV